jgi:hypothetical protein
VLALDEKDVPKPAMSADVKMGLFGSDASIRLCAKNGAPQGVDPLILYPVAADLNPVAYGRQGC